MIIKIKDYVKNLSLKRQLGFVILFSLIISCISIIIILPNLLTPFYEKNIYELLNQPLSFIESNTDSSSNNIAFISLFFSNASFTGTKLVVSVVIT